MKRVLLLSLTTTHIYGYDESSSHSSPVTHENHPRNARQIVPPRQGDGGAAGTIVKAIGYCRARAGTRGACVWGQDLQTQAGRGQGIAARTRKDFQSDQRGLAGGGQRR